MSDKLNPAAVPTPAQDAEELDRRLGPLEIVMRKMAADPRLRNAGMSMWILDREPDWDRLVQAWDRATRVIPRMRQRLVDPPLGLGVPYWISDGNFDLHYHLRRVRVPEPGTLRQLLDLARPVLMSPSDPARPAWEIIVVEGLEGGRAAVLQKGDHTMIDGQGGMAMMQVICDLERDAPAVAMPPEPEPDTISSTAMLRADFADRLREAPRVGIHGVERVVGVAADAIRHPWRTVTSTTEMAASLTRVLGAMRAPKSPLFEARSLSHHYDVLEISVDDLRRAGKSAGGSINDAFLAGLLGGMRIYHDRHDTPIETMTIGFTVSTRRESDPLTSNRFTDVSIVAPVGLTDPRERIERIHEQVLTARAEPALAAFDSIAPVMSMLPTSLLTAAFGGAGGDMNASNVMGPPIPLYMAGARIERLFGFAPLAGCPMIASLISVMGICCLGINSDPAAIPDSDVLTDCMREGFEEVLTLAGEHGGVAIPTRTEPTSS